MTVYPLRALRDNYIFALQNDEGVALIDPGEAAPVLHFLHQSGKPLKQILCTHHHWDHVQGIPELVDRYDCEVLCSQYDLARIPGANRPLADDQKFRVMGEECQAIGIPGHTLGHIAFYFASHGWIFVGDTLFSAGCGRLFEGTLEQMFESLSRLRSLPTDTQVFFGHEYTLNNLDFVCSRLQEPLPPELIKYRLRCQTLIEQGVPTVPTTIAQELKINPFLKAQTLTELKPWREARNHWSPRGI